MKRRAVLAHNHKERNVIDAKATEECPDLMEDEEMKFFFVLFFLS